MRKIVMTAALVAATLFGIGYLAGQIRGASAGNAAAVATATPTETAPDGGPAGRPALGPRADGTVTAINGNTITVKADSDLGQSEEYGKVTTIVLSGSTVYEAGHDSGTTATKSSIAVGSYIVATGTLSGDGTSLDAAQVHVMPAGMGPRNGTTGSPAGDNGSGPNA
jgi:hypothetical protein